MIYFTKFKEIFINFYKKNKLLFFLILIGFFAYSFISFPSGRYYCFGDKCGLYFWGAHIHDGIWHLAVIENSFKSFPFLNPVFSGAILTGYNFLLDFIIYLFTKIGFSSLDLYFRIFPFIWFVFYTYTTLKLAEKISKRYLFRFFLLFFNYFGASFGVLLSLYHNKTIFDSASRLAMQPLLSPVNLQFSISLIFLNLILINFFDKNLLKKYFLYGLFLFINFGLKFYGGLISLFLIIILILIENTKLLKKIYGFLLIFLFSVIAILFFYNPFYSLKTGFPLIFSPFSQVNYLIEQPSLFYMPKLANALYVLKSGGFGPRLFFLEVFLIILFFILHYGTRFFGFFYYFNYFLKNRKIDFYFAIFITIIFSSFLTIFFVQKGEWWNTIQFSYYGIFLANIFIAKFLSKFNLKNIFLKSFLIFLILLNIPENLDIIKNFNPLSPGNYISKNELEGLFFLKKQKDGVIFAINGKNDPVIENAYISVFSKKAIFLSDIHILKITGIDYYERLNMILKNNCNIFKKINYLYEKKDNTFLYKFEKCNLNLIKIFENKEVLIYKII